MARHRLFPFGVTVGTLTIFFLLLGEAALLKSHLLPKYVMMYSFAAFILYLTGLIETAIQLFGAPVRSPDPYSTDKCFADQ